VPEWLAWVWRAFFRLSAERLHQVRGFASPLGAMRLTSEPARIPWTAVQAWGLHHGYSAEDIAFLDALLGCMDDEFLDFWRTKQKGAS
jgi:hypothetical protein